jgi:phosphoribosylamine--glycine ligase
VVAILESDFAVICEAMVNSTLTQEMVTFANLATVCKYTVPDGYPDHPAKDILIDIQDVQDKEQLYLGAVNLEEGQLYATGSRTAAVVGIALNVVDAEKIAEAEVSRIKGMLFHREDIGTRELINRRIQQMEALREKDYRLV